MSAVIDGIRGPSWIAIKGCLYDEDPRKRQRRGIRVGLQE